MRNVYKVLVRKYEGRDHLEDLSIDGNNIKVLLGKMLREASRLVVVSPQVF
jgi:hypothetical protein